MGFSKLATGEKIADGGRSTPRQSKISGVGIHHNAGVDSYSEAWNPRREVSANYWIMNDGTIIPHIDETRRAFTSGSAGYPAGAAADHRNITVEVSNSPEGVKDGSWAISDAALKSLIALIGDVYARHGLGKVTRGAAKGVGIHSDWVPTACPGPYIKSKLGYIIEQAEKARTGGKPAPSPAPSGGGKKIVTTSGWWNYKTADDAKATRNAQRIMPAGTYEITRMSDGVPHLRNVNGQHSGWVHPSVLGGPAPASQKSVSQMATEVIAGKHGNGHAARQQSLGVDAATYAMVRAEVNRRV